MNRKDYTRAARIIRTLPFPEHSIDDVITAFQLFFIADGNLRFNTDKFRAAAKGKLYVVEDQAETQ